jgi:hypothetical protein
MLTSSLLASLEDIDSDWQLIPCDDRKRPINPDNGHPQDDWATHATDLDGIAALATSPHVHAIGLVLGPASGVMAVDFDGSGSTATFKQVFGRPHTDLPPTVTWSSGRPNRRQLAFRVPFDYYAHLRGRRIWQRNGSTVLELRWAGHQSVIAGAHPDTAGYHWIPDRSPADIRVADAPDWLLEPLIKPPTESADADYQPTEADAERAQDLLSHIQPRDDYPSWLSIGMALHSVNPGFLAAWVEWSKGCSNFDEEECLRKWASFKGRGVTIGTLYWYAEQDGYIPTTDEPFEWNPPADTTEPAQASPADELIDGLTEDLEHARDRLHQQLANLNADINLRTILPPLLAEAIIAKAHSMQAHPSAFLGPLLTATASVIGTRARVHVNAGWSEPFVIWCGNILPPSAMKSAIADVIGNVLMHFQLVDLKHHQEAFKQAKAEGGDLATITPPRRWLVQDATYERIAQILAEPRTHGLLSYQDELAGWFERIDERNSAGARAGWLSLWSGAPAMVDRKVAASSIAPRSAVSLFGNVQPDRLVAMVTSTEDDTAAAGDGLWARFLWCRPPQQPWRYKAQGVSITNEIKQLVKALDTIPNQLSTDLADATSAMEVRIPDRVTQDLAAPIWEQWADDSAGSSNPARAAFLGKLRGYSVRLAGLLFMLELAEAAAQSRQLLSTLCSVDELTATWYVDVPAASMAAALELCTYFLHQFDAIQAEMGSGDISVQVARFLRKATESGKSSVTPRDVITWRVFGRKQLSTTDALRFLRQLVESYGHGVMAPGRRKGSMVWQPAKTNC